MIPAIGDVRYNVNGVNKKDSTATYLFDLFAEEFVSDLETLLRVEAPEEEANGRK